MANEIPAAVSWDLGRIDVFALGKNGHIQYNFFAIGRWNSWRQLDATTNSALIATSLIRNDLHIWIRGTDNHIWHVGLGANGAFFNEDLGGGTNYAPAAISIFVRSGNIKIGKHFVFHVGGEGSIFYKVWGSTWGPWISLGGPGAIGQPRVTSAGESHIELIVQGKDLAYYRNTFNIAFWGGWQSLGGMFASAPTNIGYGINGDNTFNVAAMGVGMDLVLSLIRS